MAGREPEMKPSHFATRIPKPLNDSLVGNREERPTDHPRRFWTTSANPLDIRHQVITMAGALAWHGNTLLALWPMWTSGEGFSFGWVGRHAPMIDNPGALGQTQGRSRCESAGRQSCGGVNWLVPRASRRLLTRLRDVLPISVSEFECSGQTVLLLRLPRGPRSGGVRKRARLHEIHQRTLQGVLSMAGS